MHSCLFQPAQALPAGSPAATGVSTLRGGLDLCLGACGDGIDAHLERDGNASLSST